MVISKLEKTMGIETFTTSSQGIGGTIRQNIEDFVVNEMLIDGSIAEITKEKIINQTPLGVTNSDGTHILCVLVKRNWDTFWVMKIIAKKLDINPRNIHFAGIKDKKAITSQYLTISGIPAQKIISKISKDIEIYPIGSFHEKMSSYYLLGNQFNLTIRNIKNSQKTIKERIEKTTEEILKTGGMANFFGYQRFGTIRPITHLVGKALVEGNIQKAIMILLAEASKNEHPESQQARIQLKNNSDFHQALIKFPKNLRYERLILQHLVRRQNDFTGAFKKLPIKLQGLFVHAYQSYLFNKFLSQRIKTRLLWHIAEEGDYAVKVQKSGLPMLQTGTIVNANTLKSVNKQISSGKMRVAIPIVGHKHRLSQGNQGEIEKKILETEKISLHQFKVQVLPEINLKGWLRTAITPIKYFAFNEISNDENDSSKLQVKIKLRLLRSSYATMLLRELMKPKNIIQAGF